MKLKKVYKVVFRLCGIVLLISGIGCIVAGILLQHDDQLSKNSDSQSRVYGTQYWLGLLLIFYGVLVIAMGNVRKKMKLIVFNLVTTIPLIILTLTGSILHGTSFAYFTSMERHQSYLTNVGYQCIDTDTDMGECLCKRPLKENKHFPVLCSEQSKLVTLHGTIFSFVVISFGLLFGILFSSMLFILQMQLPVNANAAENRGFSNHEENRVEHNPSHNRSQENLTIPTAESPINHDPPPAYDSLVTSFVMTSRITNIRTDPPNAFPRRPAEVNHHATVHYRGELTSDPDSSLQARGGQATLTVRDEDAGDNSEHGDEDGEDESSMEAVPSIITEDGTTSGSSEHGTRNYAQLDHVSQSGNVLDISPPLLDNPPNVTLSESDPHQEITPEDNENAENIEQIPLEDERSERHANVPQEEDLVATRVMPGYNTVNNGVEVEQSRFLELEAGSSVLTLVGVSHVPELSLSSTIDANSSPSRPQTGNIRASATRSSHLSPNVQLLDSSVIDV